MSQLTLRISEELARHIKAAAKAQGMSVNKWATELMESAVNPDLASDERAGFRERLARAGLLVPASEITPPTGPRPSSEELARARASAARGTLLSDLVSEDRG